ncbi:MAG: adenosylcobinamide-GDP ribazoletransferase, partial [Alphaproteobacteria bacterium]
AVAWLARRALGGYTGDALGAAQQAAECAVLVAAAAALGQP